MLCALFVTEKGSMLLAFTNLAQDTGRKPEGKKQFGIPGRTYTVKGKAVPLQARTGPMGSRKLRFPDFVTTAQDGGKVVSLTHRSPLPPGNAPGPHFC